MSSAEKKPAFDLKRFVLVLVVAYPLLFGFFLLFPRVYSTAFLPLLEPLGRLVAPNCTLQEVTADADDISFGATSDLLNRFINKQGKPLSLYSFSGRHHIRAMNVYPVIVFALLLAWPMDLRRKGVAVLIAALLLVLVGAWELLVMVRWVGVTALAKIWPQIQREMTMTPADLAVFESIQAGMDRLTIAKSFVSTGGRQFTSTVICLLAVGAARLLPPRPRQPAE